MSVIQERIKKVQSLLNEVYIHPMSFDVKEDSVYYTVIFPQEINGLGGIRIAHTEGKEKTLKTLLEKLEHFWKLDNPVLYPDYK